MASILQDHQLAARYLPILDRTVPHAFLKPVKRINEGHDVPHFLTSHAYRDIGTFIMQLNIAMCPRKKSTEEGQVESWQLDSPIALPASVKQLQELVGCIDDIIDEAPPDTGPRRFGNVSFRKWYKILESQVRDLLDRYVPKSVLDFTSADGTSALDELAPYLLGGFGSAQRLDYGTGHELSFLAFIACIWKLGGFTTEPSQDAALARSIVIGVIEPYLRVVRRLILIYTLEPAGSHGVWGLDDHSFISYILGSAQYCPPISDGDPMPLEGALANSPNPGDVAKKAIVDRERKHNMYFSAVGFINDVKTGPFWEHSPILFDISGVRSGWGKINKGMIKMYNAEVLSKFPVVQHFPFGSLFSWDQDPYASTVAPSVHTASQPSAHPSLGPAAARPPQESTRAPWASTGGGAMGNTAAPWASSSAPARGAMPLTKARWATGGGLPSRSVNTNLPDHGGPTSAPWATSRVPKDS